MQLLHEKVLEAAECVPDSPALIFQDNIITYGEIQRKVSAFGHWLATNLEKGSRVAVCLGNRPESVESVYALVSAGMIAVPLDADVHENTLLYVLRDCGARTIITSKKQIEKIVRVSDKIQVETIILCDRDEAGPEYDLDCAIHDLQDIIASSADSRITRDQADTDTAFILYTTGTTGLKKGTKLSHLNLLAATENIREFMGLPDGIVESVPMPIAHAFGFGRLRCVLELGGTVLLENGLLRADRVLYNMEKHKASSLASASAGFEILLSGFYSEAFQQIGPQLKYIEIGSAPLRIELKRQLMDCCPNAFICMNYGLTEASRSTFIEFHSSAEHLHTVGKAAPNVSVKVVDEEQKSLNANDLGEIVVNGKMVMQGYWNNAGQTKAVLSDDWFHTGDVGFIDDEGYIHLVGRTDEIINIGGTKVGPAEVEDVILQFDGVVEAAVVGIAGSSGFSKQRIKAFIVVGDESSFAGVEDLTAFCLGGLERYKVPNEFVVVDSLPKTSSGKLQRRLLTEENEPHR